MTTTVIINNYLGRVRKVCGIALLSGFVFMSDAALAANGSVVYTYDALGRLSTATYDTGVIIIYTYDANGNRLSQTINVNTSAGVWGSVNWAAANWSP